MSSEKAKHVATAFKITAALTPRGVRLRWKPLRRATAYEVQWLRKPEGWVPLWELTGEDARPGKDGLVEHLDEAFQSLPIGGTYRVVAYFGTSVDARQVTSKSIKVTDSARTKKAKRDLIHRLERRKMPARLKALIARLKSSSEGWRLLLPADAGTLLGKRIELEIVDVEVTEAILNLLELILVRLPKLAGRAEKAWQEQGGGGLLDEHDQLARPRIRINQDEQSRRSTGAWTMVIGIKGSDYAWHVEFVRTRFHEIWAGD
jgi:hypothetical protein